jgi:hypothetical protein
VLAGVSVLAACGGPAAEPVELVEHCGTNEPVTVLALDSDVYPSRNPLHAGRKVGDRVVLLVEQYAEGTEFPAESGEDVIGTQVWAVGACGEDPAMIAEDVDYLYDSRHAFGDDAVLACRRATDEVLVLDPGGGEPRVLMEGVGCAVLPAGGGVVAVVPDEPGLETGSLVFSPSVEDPDATPQVIYDDALVPFIDTGFYFSDIRRLRTTGNEALVLTSAGAIVAVDVTDGSTAIEVDDAAGFELSYDGRFILWQPGPPVMLGGAWDLREMYLLDRETGEQLELGEARFGIGSGGVQSGMVRASADFFDENTTIVLLPSLQQLTFGPDRFVNGRHPDSGLVMWSPSDEDGSPGPLHVHDPESGEDTAVFDRYGGWSYVGDQFLMLEETAEDEYTLWERYLDEPEQVRVVERVFQPYFVSERRVAGVRDLGGTRVGSLHVIDRDNEAELVVEERVNAFSSRLNWSDAFAPAFAYAVHEEDGVKIRAARVD